MATYIRGRERVAWQDIYAIQQTSSILAAPGFQTSDIGIKGTGAAAGAFLLKLTDHPNIEPPNPSLLQELTTGRSELLNEEYQAVAQEAGSVSLNMQLHAYNLSLFMRGLMQDGSGETAADPTVQSSIPYKLSDVTDYMTMFRSLDTASELTDIGGNFVDPSGVLQQDNFDMSSHIATGMVPRSVTIAGEEGGIASISADCAVSYAGVSSICGLLNQKTHSTSRLRMIPTPAQAGWTVDPANFNIYHDGIAFSAVNLVTNFGSAPGAGEVNVQSSTGLLQFNDTDAGLYNQTWISHDGWTVGAGTGDSPFPFVHPFDLNPDSEAPLLWQNATIKMKPITRDTAQDDWTVREDPAVWITMNLPSWSLTLNNNLGVSFYDEPFITNYKLGRFNGEGNITVPWGQDKSATVTTPTLGGNSPLMYFLAGIPMRLRCLWGGTDHLDTGTVFQQGYHMVDANADGGVAIDQTIRYTDQSVEGETELGQVSTFQLVSDVGSENVVRPDPDVSLAFRSSIAYAQAKLDRGQSTGYSYPETL